MTLPMDDGIAFNLLDRLTAPADEVRIRGHDLPDLHYLRGSIRRDIEALLNMRQRGLSIPASLEQAQNSVVTFGIPDFSGANLSTEEQREALRLSVEEAIRGHEPRISFVEVRLLNKSEQLERTLRFQIDVYLKVDEENPPKLMFESSLDPLTHNVSVASGRIDG